MNRTTNASSTLLALLLISLPIIVSGQKDKAGETIEILPQQPRAVTQRQFYEMQVSMEQLRRQMNELRIAVEAYKSRELSPEVYRTLLNRLKPTRMTHEIVLTNGTIVRGNIINEDIDRVTLETSLGNLTLDKSTVRSIGEMADFKPKIDFSGDAREEIHDDHRVYSGRVHNEGITRGDFVRVIFKLWSAETKLVAVDSAFVDGSNMSYISGVFTDTAIGPGKDAGYQVRVNVPRDKPVGYITREIHLEQVD